MVRQKNIIKAVLRAVHYSGRLRSFTEKYFDYVDFSAAAGFINGPFYARANKIKVLTVIPSSRMSSADEVTNVRFLIKVCATRFGSTDWQSAPVARPRMLTDQICLDDGSFIVGRCL